MPGGTLTFQPGTTVQAVTLAVVGFPTRRCSDLFTVSLSSAVNAAIGDSFAFGTIYDDDGTREQMIDDQTPMEVESGAKGLALRVTLSAPALPQLTLRDAARNSSPVPAAHNTRTG